MPAVAAEMAVPLPLSTPVTVVEIVMAGVDVAVATLPENPLAETTETLVTVPAPAGVAHVPSPLQNVELLALIPESRLPTGKFPVTPPLPDAAKFIALTVIVFTVRVSPVENVSGTS